MMAVAGQLLLVLMALAAVIGLILAAAWAARRYGGATLLGAGSQIRTVAATNVGQRERVLLLEVHGVQLLVGVAAGGVSLLREFPPGTTQVLVEADASASRSPLQDARELFAGEGPALRFKDAFAAALKRALGQPPA